VKALLLDSLVKAFEVSGNDAGVREVGGLREEGDVRTKAPDIFVDLK
jgi:hypothetical protein